MVKNFAVFFLSLILAVALAAQTASQQPAPPPNPAQQPQIGQQPSTAAPEEPEHHISQAEADELFKAVDEILAFDSKSTGLPIKHPVKRKLTSRKEVQKYFLDSFKDDKSAQHMT